MDGMTGARGWIRFSVWCLMDRAAVVLGDDGKVTGSSSGFGNRPLEQSTGGSPQQELWIQLQGGAIIHMARALGLLSLHVIGLA